MLQSVPLRAFVAVGDGRERELNVCSDALLAPLQAANSGHPDIRTPATAYRATGLLDVSNDRLAAFSCYARR